MAIAPTNKREADEMALKLFCLLAFLLVGLITAGGLEPQTKAPGHRMSPGARIRSAGYRGLRRSPKRTRAATGLTVDSTAQ